MSQQITVFLQFDQSVLVKKQSVKLSDVATVYATDPAIKQKVGAIELYCFPKKEKEKQVFSVSVPRANYISCAFTEFAKKIDTAKEVEIFYKETNSMRAIKNILEENYKLGIVRYQNVFEQHFQTLFHEKDLKNALDSHLCIQKMLATDYVRSVSADRTLPDGEWVGHKLEIALPGDLVNVLILGEVLELGERVSAFTVESEGKVLFQGTSVGHCRACLLPEGNYKRLTVTFTESADVPVLGGVSVHRFEDLPDEPPETTVGLNLAELSGATTAFSPDRKEAVVNFGGVFPFNMLRFVLEEGGSYEVFAFNGTAYESLATGSCDHKTRFKITTDRLIEGSYQVKVVATAPLNEIDAVQVKWKPEEDKK